MSADPRPLRTFGRIQSRKLKPRQAGLMETLLPSIAVPDGPVSVQGQTWLEIGFGGGEHMVAQAARHPDVSIIGAEPFVNGVASALRHIDEAGVNTVRLHHGDARELMARMPGESLTRLYLLFPDPWPKARHNKRRIVQADFVVEAARLLRSGGRFRFATDVASYADWALQTVLASTLFDWPAQKADDWRVPPDDHITTRYEVKGLGDCAPVFFDFYRR